MHAFKYSVQAITKYKVHQALDNGYVHICILIFVIHDTTTSFQSQNHFLSHLIIIKQRITALSEFWIHF